MTELQEYLYAISPGPIRDPTALASFLAACWDDLAGNNGGMTAEKLRGRMEAVTWEPPVLTFVIERHGGTVMGSSKAELQQWRFDLESGTASSATIGYRQVRATQPRLNVAPLADEVVALIRDGKEDPRLKRYEDGRVRVLIGQLLPESTAVKQTVAGRRSRFRAALTERLAHLGWRTCGYNVYTPLDGPVPETPTSAI